MKDLLDIGFGNFVSSLRLITLVTPDSAPARRLINEARERGALIDATSGRKTRSILVMDSDHIILSALATDTLYNRYMEKMEGTDEN
ncbi:MAG TPA: DUF370 domain-containing protein [Clostridiaceae bacterium]|nr:DUF370 domain-containing protein [Clostridiaceae bacterium]